MRLFDEELEKQDAPEGDSEHEVERAVRCVRCGHAVARVRDLTQVGDGSLHVFVNPQGDVFELNCFATADGAVAHGRASMEFTWFPGYAWRFASCRGCGSQLGWRYEGPSIFWGLAKAAIAFD